MKTNSPVFASDVQIHIDIGVGERSKDSLQTYYTHFSYTITDETRHADVQEGYVWQIEGHLERVLYDENNIVCSPNFTLSELCGQIAPACNNCKIYVEYGNGKTIEIQNVRFKNYMRTIEAGWTAMEEVDFDGAIDHKNIIK